MDNPLKNNLNKANEVVTSKLSVSNKQESAYRTMTSEDLFAGRRELLITHATESYRLRITNQGKLILTK
jgi:hemin uptake protein HemP